MLVGFLNNSIGFVDIELIIVAQGDLTVNAHRLVRDGFVGFVNVIANRTDAVLLCVVQADAGPRAVIEVARLRVIVTDVPALGKLKADLKGRDLENGAVKLSPFRIAEGESHMELLITVLCFLISDCGIASSKGDACCRDKQHGKRRAYRFLHTVSLHRGYGEFSKLLKPAAREQRNQ